MSEITNPNFTYDPTELQRVGITGIFYPGMTNPHQRELLMNDGLFEVVWRVHNHTGTKAYVSRIGWDARTNTVTSVTMCNQYGYPVCRITKYNDRVRRSNRYATIYQMIIAGSGFSPMNDVGSKAMVIASSKFPYFTKVLSDQHDLHSRGDRVAWRLTTGDADTLQGAMTRFVNDVVTTIANESKADIQFRFFMDDDATTHLMRVWAGEVRPEQIGESVYKKITTAWESYSNYRNVQSGMGDQVAKFFPTEESEKWFLTQTTTGGVVVSAIRFHDVVRRCSEAMMVGRPVQEINGKPIFSYTIQPRLYRNVQSFLASGHPAAGSLETSMVTCKLMQDEYMRRFSSISRTADPIMDDLSLSQMGTLVHVNGGWLHTRATNSGVHVGQLMFDKD